MTVETMNEATIRESSTNQGGPLRYDPVEVKVSWEELCALRIMGRSGPEPVALWLRMVRESSTLYCIDATVACANMTISDAFDHAETLSCAPCVTFAAEHKGVIHRVDMEKTEIVGWAITCIF